jgi:hypothetical protein
MATKEALKISIQPNEIVFPQVEITVRAPQALDPEAAQGGIVVRGVRGQVRLSRNGRLATWSAIEALPAGHHLLLVGELLTRKGDKLEAEVMIPFFVSESSSPVPATLRVESLTRLRIGELATERLASDRRPRGPYIELIKAANRRSGAAVELAFDERGRKVDARKVLRQVLENQARRYGKLHETLFDRVQKARAGERLPVAIWLRSEAALAVGDKKARGETAKPSKEEARRQKEISAAAYAFAERLEGGPGQRGEGKTGQRAEARREQPRARPDEAAPVVYAELTPEEIAVAARNREVLAIFLHETEGIEDLSDSIAIANSDDVHSLGFRGSGVKVAVWEDAPDNTSNLSITARYKSSGFATSEHARHTHGIVKNVEKNKPHGHAPSCALHSANSKDLDALRWAARDKGCTVISQSFHRSSEPGSASLSYDDIYKDWLALRWPYPTICQAAGNFWQGDPDNIQPPSNEYVNHKGFNGLGVGNHNDAASAMAGDSVFRNPSSDHGDRELPEIAANGTSVTTVGLTKSGTSMASPAAAGCVALLQSADATLKSWPEGCRALMLAGAKRNVVGNTWWQDVTANTDASDGTGATDALEALNIAQQRRSRNAAGTQRGWDVGTLRSSDFGSNKRSTFSYFIKLSSLLLAPRHVKVALAWDSKLTTLSILGLELLLSSRLTVDLDLQIFDSRGNQVGYSGSWDNSYEIAEFDGQPGETYTIKIRRWSGTDDVWYGIAWTVTGGWLWADVTRFTALQQLIDMPGGR